MKNKAEVQKFLHLLLNSYSEVVPLVVGDACDSQWEQQYKALLYCGIQADFNLLFLGRTGAVSGQGGFLGGDKLMAYLLMGSY